MSDEKLPTQFGKSIFLAGPTPRDDKTKSWRKQAIELLKVNLYDGVVYVPERKDWKVKFDYLDQVEWELTALNSVTDIVFWVPRDLETMPAFTTNVEFGMFVDDTVKLWYGRPDDSPKNRYLDFLYEKYRTGEIYTDLKGLINGVVYGQ